MLERCEQLRGETDGYFDARAASADVVDPSGLVKGWSVDRRRRSSTRPGFATTRSTRPATCASAGAPCPSCAGASASSIRSSGTRSRGSIETTELAVATSGEYARGEHVFDPHTAPPPEGILSVTITGPDLATADAYATAALAMGAERAVHWTARLRGYEAMTILADGRVLSTPGFGS